MRIQAWLEAGQPISRYMDLGKFAAILYEEGLYFALAGELSNDPHEGALGAGDVNAALKQNPTLAEKAAFSSWIEEWRKNQLNSVAVSCWYTGDTESHAMWQLYGNTLAVESTVPDVLSALENKNVICRKVKYRSYERRPSTDLDPVKVLTFKRPCFKHEQEVRFFYKLETGDTESVDRLRARLPLIREHFHPTRGLKVYADGLLLKAKLPKIVKRVRLAPTAPRWLRDAVTHLLNMHNPKISWGCIKGSELDQGPYADLFPTEV